MDAITTFFTFLGNLIPFATDFFGGTFNIAGVAISNLFAIVVGLVLLVIIVIIIVASKGRGGSKGRGKVKTSKSEVNAVNPQNQPQGAVKQQTNDDEEYITVGVRFSGPATVNTYSGISEQKDEIVIGQDTEETPDLHRQTAPQTQQTQAAQTQQTQAAQAQQQATQQAQQTVQQTQQQPPQQTAAEQNAQPVAQQATQQPATETVTVPTQAENVQQTQPVQQEEQVQVTSQAVEETATQQAAETTVTTPVETIAVPTQATEGVQQTQPVQQEEQVQVTAQAVEESAVAKEDANSTDFEDDTVPNEQSTNEQAVTLPQEDMSFEEEPTPQAAQSQDEFLPVEDETAVENAVAAEDADSTDFTEDTVTVTQEADEQATENAEDDKFEDDTVDAVQTPAQESKVTEPIVQEVGVESQTVQDTQTEDSDVNDMTFDDENTVTRPTSATQTVTIAASMPKTQTKEDPMKEKETKAKEPEKKPAPKKAATEGLQGKFEISLAVDGYRFCLYANNGQLMYESVGFVSIEGCKKGIETFRKTLREQPYSITRDKRGRFRFVFNKKYQGETYTDKPAATRAAESVKRWAADAKVVVNFASDEEMAVYQEGLNSMRDKSDVNWDAVAKEEAAAKKSGKFVIETEMNGDEIYGYRFYLLANNAQILYTSALYASVATATAAIDAFKRAVYIGNFYVDEDKTKHYRYILRGNNITYVGESYANKAQAEKSIESVKNFVKTAALVPYTPDAE